MRYFLLLLLFAACQKQELETPDPHSFANFDQVRTTHLDLDLAVDFKKKELRGTAIWTLEHQGNSEYLILDENGLTIEKVVLNDSIEGSFYHGEAEELHGRPLKIPIRADTRKVAITYKSSPDAVALQWLVPEQTADKKHPFLFSQGQSIWTRTWIPCQDSPSVRFTYNAKLTVPKDLLALMSAQNPQQKNDKGEYFFKQTKPIPAYLMAIAVGDVAFKAVDGRTGVYAEPSVVEAAAFEFAEMGQMVTAAEKLFGPYRWGRYDVIVLPPSFPYGGMENPNLTFLTPGILAGDRSLNGLLAHELGHSWSGNLTTNATWDDIWLNEGFTTYVENRIVEEIYGPDEAKMLEVISRRELQDAMDEFGENNPDTRLKVETQGKNPDDAISAIPYDKGFAFLQVVEDAVGRDRFDIFLRKYFDAYAFKSVTTPEFKAFFDKHLIAGDEKLAQKIDYDSWVHGAGIPKNALQSVSDKFKRVDSLQQSWRNTGVKGLAQQIRSTHERRHFIDNLPNDLTVAEMKALDAEFEFTKKGNFIIRRQWFVQAIKHGYTEPNPAIEQFLLTSSRTASVEMLYKQMVQTPQGKVWAIKIFEQARPGYHGTTVQTIQKLFK